MCQAQLDLVRKKIKQGPCCEGIQSNGEDRYYLLRNAMFEVREGVWKQGGCPLAQPAAERDQRRLSQGDDI